ncbi:protein transport protein bos1 [Coemansia guatemalensis]|uniref:Protein transport protein BOS1 n=1 Tax=Coemansia guatemalensis TaxID=2761395 RepID=A0A9W8HY01_9FUNG|nr:protein transport protein bos1 [Coemansia guatemalensis]
MTSEYNAAQRVLHRIKQNVDAFDLNNSSDNAVTQAAIVQDLQTLDTRISEYRLLGRQESNQRKHKMMLDRVTHMSEEQEQLRRRFEKIKKRREDHAAYNDQRTELFQRTSGTAARTQMDTTIMMDPQDEASFWSRSEQALDGYIAQGVASLDSLREQRGILNEAHKRILNADNTLGLSRSVITLINRRTTQDKIILTGGMLFTCICIYFIIHWFG